MKKSFKRTAAFVLALTLVAGSTPLANVWSPLPKANIMQAAATSKTADKWKANDILEPGDRIYGDDSSAGSVDTWLFIDGSSTAITIDSEDDYYEVNKRYKVTASYSTAETWASHYWAIYIETALLPQDAPNISSFKTVYHYGDTITNPSVSAGVGATTYKYESTGNTPAYNSSTPPTAVGTYKLTVTYAGNNTTYKSASSTKEFTIFPALSPTNPTTPANARYSSSVADAITSIGYDANGANGIEDGEIDSDSPFEYNWLPGKQVVIKSTAKLYFQPKKKSDNTLVNVDFADDNFNEAYNAGTYTYTFKVPDDATSVEVTRARLKYIEPGEAVSGNAIDSVPTWNYTVHMTAENLNGASIYKQTDVDPDNAPIYDDRIVLNDSSQFDETVKFTEDEILDAIAAYNANPTTAPDFIKKTVNYKISYTGSGDEKTSIDIEMSLKNLDLNGLSTDENGKLTSCTVYNRTSLEKAIAAADKADSADDAVPCTITLGDNIFINMVDSANPLLTINTTGKNITIDGQTQNDAPKYGFKGISNYEGTDGHGIKVTGTGKLTFQNVKMTDFAGNKANDKTYPIWAAQTGDGTLTLKKVKIDQFSRTAVKADSGNVIIDGCTFTGGNTATDSNNKYYQRGVEVKNANVTLKNTTMTDMLSSVQPTAKAACVDLISTGTGTVTIESGSYRGEPVLLAESAAAGTIRIKGGTFDGPLDFEGRNGNQGYNVYFEGGSFTANLTDDVINLDLNTPAYKAVPDNETNPTIYTVELDTTLVSARIGDNYYESLRAAVYLLDPDTTTDDEIKIIANDTKSFADNTYLVINKNVTIVGETDENDTPKYTIDGLNSENCIKTEANVSIANLKLENFDQDTIQCDAGSLNLNNVTITNFDAKALNASGSSSVTIEDCTFTSESDTGTAINADGANITVKSGDYKAATVLGCSEGGTLKIEDGKFNGALSGTMSISGGVFSVNPGLDNIVTSSSAENRKVIYELNNETYKFGVANELKSAEIEVGGMQTTGEGNAQYSYIPITVTPNPAKISGYDINYDYEWTITDDTANAPLPIEDANNANVHNAKYYGIYICKVTSGDTSIKVNTDYLNGLGTMPGTDWLIEKETTLPVNTSATPNSPGFVINQRGNIDIRGKGTENNENPAKSGVRTTYSDGGYWTRIQVVQGSQTSRLRDIPANGKITKLSGNVEDGIQVKIVPAVDRTKDPNSVTITYTVANASDDIKTVKIGSGADIMIVNDDSAKVRKDGNRVIMSSSDTTLNLIVGTPSPTDSNDKRNIWPGKYSGYQNRLFQDGYDENVGDSALTYSWEITLGKGEVKVMSTKLYTLKSPVATNYTFKAPTNLEYNGSAKRATVTKKTGATDAGEVDEVQYLVDGIWTATPPTEAGTYKVGVMTKESLIYAASALPISNDDWTFTIEKANPLKKAPTSKNPVLLGNEVQLINPATFNTGATGTIKYAVVKKEEGDPTPPADNDERWTDDYSKVTASEIGTYYVWYKGTLDAPSADNKNGNYISDIPLQYIEVTVSNYIPSYSEPVFNVFSISVTNGTVNNRTYEEYDSDTVVEVKSDKPPKGKKFGYWKDKDGKTVSYNPIYTFKITYDRELEAVYLDEDDEFNTTGNCVEEAVVIDKTNKKIKFRFTNAVPEDCTIVKAGMVATSNINQANSLAIGNAEYDRYKDNITVHNFGYTWTKTNVEAGQAWYVKGYLIYKDKNGVEHTVYSNLQKATLNGYQTIHEDKIVGTSFMDSVIVDKKNKEIKFVSLLNVPADCTIKFAGIVATSDSTKKDSLTKITATEKSMVNGCYVRGMSSSKHTVRFEWTKTKVGKETWYVRPYLVYIDPLGTERIVYGDLTTQKLS